MIMFWILVILIAVIDQILKNLVRIYVPLGFSIDTFLPFLKITNTKNLGAAFGSLAGMRIYLIVSTLFIIALVIYYIFKKNIKNLWLLTFLAFVLGGGLSNLYDRVFYGFVTDYIKLSFFPPVCNLGDYFICFGTVAVLIFTLKGTAVKK